MWENRTLSTSVDSIGPNKLGIPVQKWMDFPEAPPEARRVGNRVGFAGKIGVQEKDRHGPDAPVLKLIQVRS